MQLCFPFCGWQISRQQKALAVADKKAGRNSIIGKNSLILLAFSLEVMSDG
jgi:hypothetical protein